MEVCVVAPHQKPAYVSIRQHTSACSIRQHTSGEGAETEVRVVAPQQQPAYVSIRQHAPAYVSMRQERGVRRRCALLHRNSSLCAYEDAYVAE